MSRRVVALSGGIGGAKLALGLQRVLSPGALSVVANTGDDFEHLGLAICPDLDTLLYTLAGVANPELGWGRSEESWNFMAELERLGGEGWFRLGDRDLAVHIERTRRLAAGESLSAIMGAFARQFGLDTQLLPMSDERVRTFVDTDVGTLAFQQYFVARQCAPRVRALHYEGSAAAHAAAGALAALDQPGLAAIVICPSNPYLSIDPILAIPGWRAALASRKAPLIAVSPLIGGAAVKGPTAKIMRELGVEVSALSVATHYAGLLDGFVLDETDAALAACCSVPVRITRTLMRSLEDRENLAREVLGFAAELAAPR